MNRLAQVAAPLAMLLIASGALAAAVSAAEQAKSTDATAAGDPAAGKANSTTCAACHGADGNSSDPQYPKLAQQHTGYTAKQLREYQSGERENAVMAGMAQALSDQDMLDLAAYFETQTLVGGAAEEEQVEKGQQIYRGGDLSRGIAACSACHGPTGRGNAGAGFPSLAGQHAQYTETQLMAFRSLQRHNDAGQMMRNIAARLSDQDMKAVASYISGLRE